MRLSLYLRTKSQPADAFQKDPRGYYTCPVQETSTLPTIELDPTLRTLTVNWSAIRCVQARQRVQPIRLSTCLGLRGTSPASSGFPDNDLRFVSLT